MNSDEAIDASIEKLKPLESTESHIYSAKHGDKEAFIYLMELYKVDMYRMGRVLLDNQSDVGDAMQETILKAYKSIKNLEKLESFKSWLLRIMVNECNNILRVRKKIAFSAQIFEEDICVDDYNFDKQPVLEAIRSLEENFRKVILLYYYEDFSIKQISKTLAISEGTVKSRLSRARKKLFETLKGGEE